MDHESDKILCSLFLKLKAPARNVIVKEGDSPGEEEHIPHPVEGVCHHNQGEPGRVSYLEMLLKINLNYY
jgi:hypothetical protein